MTLKKQIAEMGKRLKELRDIVGKTQKKLQDLGLKQSVLSSYENGDREPGSLLLTVLHGIIMLQSIILLAIAILKARAI